MQQREGESYQLQPKAMVVGQMLRPTVVKPTGVVDVGGIRLQPWAARQILGVQARELRDTIVPLDQLGIHHRNTLGGLVSVELGRERLTAIKGAVGMLRAREGSGSHVTQGIVRWASRANDAMSVRSLARQAGLSVRRVQTLFDANVGLSPRSVMRLARFQRALTMLRSPGRFRLARIAAECGYHDHAHFVRECREFAGVAPSVVAAAPEHLGDAFIES
jgi:AraC-like DNA-binding protein